MDVKMTPAVRQVADWSIEYQLLSLTLLVVGLFTTLSWEALLPDQRDVLVLGPLPVKSLTLWFAKVTANSSGVGLFVLALNFASGLIWPAALAQAGFISILRSYGAYWLPHATEGRKRLSSAMVYERSCKPGMDDAFT